MHQSWIYVSEHINWIILTSYSMHNIYAPRVSTGTEQRLAYDSHNHKSKYQIWRNVPSPIHKALNDVTTNKSNISIQSAI